MVDALGHPYILPYKYGRRSYWLLTYIPSSL